MSRKGRAHANGEDCADDYVASYAESHRDDCSESYRIDYISSALVEAVLRDYTMLFIGCGTCGFFRLSPNARRIVALDRSPKMIEKCREIVERFQLRNVEPRQGSFEEFRSEVTFDVIHSAGVHGSYLPHTEASLAKMAALVRQGGYGLFGIFPHRRSLKHLWRRIKSHLRGKPLTEIDPDRFEAMLSRQGWEVVCALRRKSGRDRYGDTATQHLYLCRRS
ncbi:MAG: methyltransferase domain-containing protein [Magnetococcales bacterium]|nr:methyltransferase domain-containing protein [Magnetococcales bacterium]